MVGTKWALDFPPLAPQVEALTPKFMPEPPRRRKKTYSVDSLNSLDSFF
jgi:hypothetical protein